MADIPFRSIPQIRAENMRLIAELEKWGYRPYRRDRNRLRKDIRDSFDYDQLKRMHDDLDGKLQHLLMKKLSENL